MFSSLNDLNNLFLAYGNGSTVTGGLPFSAFLRRGPNIAPGAVNFAQKGVLRPASSPIVSLITNVPGQLASNTVAPPVAAQTGQTGSNSNLTSNVVVSGANISQVARVSVSSSGTLNPLTIQGTVNRAAQAATVTFVGGNGGVVTSSGQFALTGNRGSLTLNLAAGQSLSDVAAQVNQSTSSTGVAADVQGNNLVFQSDTVGVNSSVRLQPLGTAASSIIGANLAQIGSIQVLTQTPGTTQTISGTVTSSASQAQLVYYGASGGTVAGSAAFQLTGTRGSLAVSINQGESLASVASQINQQTSTTGVVATLSGNNLLLGSDTTGAAATVQVSSIDRADVVSTSGVNNSQVNNVTASSINTESTEVLSGQVLQTASAASVALQGSASGTVIDTATFNLTGTLGTASLSIQQGESLADVASSVNALTSSTGVQTQVQSNQLVFQSTTVGSSANVDVELTGITHTNVVSGVNAQQLSGFQINSLTAGATETLSGTVTQTASAATVALQGSASGTVIDTATFNLSGNLGSTSISIQQGESLTAVASRINALATSTGVQAQVQSNQIVFKSTTVGSGANVGVQLTNITHTNVVTGVNAQQLSNFQINSLATGASESLSGTVTQTAGIGQLTFAGSLGFVGSSSHFTLTGSQGSASFTTSGLTAISTLASQVNSYTATTGVKAVVSGGNLLFQTVGVGSSAAVSINVTSGSFGVTGGNGNGTATGTDARATINGRSLTGNANSFQFTDALGSYSFNTVSGYTGAISAFNVNSQAGQFAVTGGNGNGTANGTDARATLNGQSLVGNGNSFQFSDAVGNYSFNTVAGYTGAISAFNVASQAGQFTVTGGNGDGSATGTDAVAVINGVQRKGTGNSFAISDANGQFQLQFASGFLGSFDPVTVQSRQAAFSLGGADASGAAHGTDFIATISDVNYDNTSNSATISENAVTYQVNFVKGFTGGIAPVTITKATNPTIIGGDKNGLAQGIDAIATINGVQQTGDGASFAVNDNGAVVTLQFVNGFSGSFDPITIAPQTQTSSTTAPSSESSLTQSAGDAAQATSSNQQFGDALLKVIRNEINGQLIQDALNQIPGRSADDSTPAQAQSSTSDSSTSDSTGTRQQQPGLGAQTGNTNRYQSTDSQKQAGNNQPVHHLNFQA